MEILTRKDKILTITEVDKLAEVQLGKIRQITKNRLQKINAINKIQEHKSKLKNENIKSNLEQIRMLEKTNARLTFDNDKLLGLFEKQTNALDAFIAHYNLSGNSKILEKIEKCKEDITSINETISNNNTKKGTIKKVLQDCNSLFKTYVAQYSNCVTLLVKHEKELQMIKETLKHLNRELDNITQKCQIMDFSSVAKTKSIAIVVKYHDYNLRYMMHNVRHLTYVKTIDKNEICWKEFKEGMNTARVCNSKKAKKLDGIVQIYLKKVK